MLLFRVFKVLQMGGVLWVLVNRVRPQLVNELLDLHLSHANLVDSGEEGKLIFQSFLLEHEIDFRRRLRALQLLTTQHFSLQFGEALSCGNEGLLVGF